MTALDRELAAMSTILDVLAPLTPDQRKAVIATVWEHYETRARHVRRPVRARGRSSGPV